MKTIYYFVPGYYEWHLIDENGKILLNVVDPLDDLCECDSYEDVLNWCESLYLEAYKHYEQNEDFNGIQIDPADIPCAYYPKTSPVQEMANALFEYYF